MIAGNLVEGQISQVQGWKRAADVLCVDKAFDWILIGSDELGEHGES